MKLQEILRVKSKVKIYQEENNDHGAMIGFVSIAKAAHLSPYLELEKEGLAKLVAVCDICPSRFDEVVEMNIGASTDKIGNSVNRYTDWSEVLKNEKVDMADISSCRSNH